LFFSLDGETETTTADLKSPFYLVNLPPNITLYFDPVATPQLPLFEIGVDGIDINWHDGNDPQFYPHLSPGPFVPSGNLIEYPGAAGLAKVDISGSFGKFGKGIIPWNGVMDLYRVGGSGDGSLTNLSGAFANANSFTGIGLGAWDVSGVTDMSYMFMYSGITDVNLEAWDTSKVKNMSNMFLTAEEFVGNGVNQWDTSSVTDMSNMFNGAAMFNAALATNGSKWDTQLVRNMNSMFSTAPAFTGGGIDTWDTSSVTDMTRMFYNDTSFDNVNLGNWNVSTVRNMGSMFAGSAFSGWSISSWNVSNVTNMAEMFQGCPNFEEQNAGGNIGNWERTEPTVSTLANVTSMNSMFAYSTKFKGEGISTWNVVGVTDMTSMFQNGGLTSSLVDWAFSLNGVIPTPPNFLTDGTDDLTTTSPLSPFGPAPVIPTQTNSTSLLSFASPPNPSYKLAPGSTIYGTAGTKFYSTNTSGAYSEIMDLAEYGTPIGAMIGNPTHYNATVFTITQTQAGGSLFFYDTSSGLSGTIGTFAAQPLPNSVFDSVGNLYMVDTAGALYKVTPSMNNQVSTDTLPIVAQLGTIGLTSIDISNNVLCWVQSAGTLGGLDLTSVGTPPTLTQIPGLVQTFLIDSNKVYYYDSSSNLSVYTNETATTLWDFAANPTYGTTPTGDLFIDRTEQTIYGICTGGGPGFGKGFRGGGVLYRFTISTGEMDVITSYFRDDGVTGSGPVSFTVVPDNGQSYVVTSGSAVAPRLRSPFLVNPRAAGPNYQVSQSTLPGYVTSCFNYGVKILTQVHGAEAWRPVETLREGDIVKTYKHGYRPITHIGKGVLINDAAIWHSSMFKAQMEGFEPLIVTGGHSILVDYLTQEEQQKQAVFWERGEEVIDDKLLMIAPVSVHSDQGTQVIHVFPLLRSE
jgi:surface protein